MLKKDAPVSDQKFELLTWLRGIAAFLVIVNHAILSASEQYSLMDEESYLQPLAFLNLGMFAVYLFFVLSGCTLTLNYANKIHNATDFVCFYIKRIFRIWPAFAVSMVAYLAFIELFKQIYHFERNAWIALFLNDYSFVNVLQYLSLTFNITGPHGLFNGPYWSLPVEFQYYLMLPFALILMRNHLLNITVPLVIGAALYFLYPLKIFHLDRIELLKMGFAFFGGVLLAKTYRYVPFRVPFNLSLTAFFLIVCICGAIVNNIIKIPEAIPFVSDVQNFWGLCALFVVAVALVTQLPAGSSSITRFLTHYGEISYSIYLFHMIFTGLAVVFIIDFAVHAYFAKFMFILMFTLIGSYLLSLVTFKWIEKPSIKWGAKVVKNLKESSNRARVNLPS